MIAKKGNKMWNIEDDVIVETTYKGNKIYQAKKGLLKDKYWRGSLKNYPTDLLCAIRNALEESIPGLAEKFNPTTPGLQYFGYKVRDRDVSKYDFSKGCYSSAKVKMYVQKKDLRIDLAIDRKYEHELQNAGYRVRYANNFQGRAGWLTGWYVPHATKDIRKVMKWLVMAFR